MNAIDFSHDLPRTCQNELLVWIGQSSTKVSQSQSTYRSMIVLSIDLPKNAGWILQSPTMDAEERQRVRADRTNIESLSKWSHKGHVVTE